jgi:predicted ester cyclase
VSETEKTMTDRNTTLTTWLDAFNRQDLETYLSYYSEDVMLYGYAPEPFDKKNVRGYYETMFADFETDSRIEDVMWDGERNAFRWRMRALQRREFMGITPSGKWVEIVGLSVMTWQDGQILERWSVMDTLAFTDLLRA